MKKHLAPIFILLLALLGVAFSNQIAGAADLSKFNAGNIMSDYVMSNKNSMTEAQIQQFLTNKNPCNDRNISKASQYPNMKYNIKDGKFVCLSNEVFNGETAAKIIWQAGQDYNINPQVLIVLLQKEQGLVTDTWPNHNIQYRSATGYGCPDNAPCEEKYYGFKNQVRNAANFFRAHLDNRSGWSKPHVPGGQNVKWSPAACGAGWVNIENRATSGLYSYTPYQPNRAALNAGYGNGDGCSAYGNRNFWAYFNDWFGPTQGIMHRGIDFSSVFNKDYYLANNSDLKAVIGDDSSTLFTHFIEHGVYEKRLASNNINITAYINSHQDLRSIYGNNILGYYIHYILYGKEEGRVAIGNIPFEPVLTLQGKNYSNVYDFSHYQSNNLDIKGKFGLNDTATLSHFIRYGIDEGRVASPDFNVHLYKNRYPDLQAVFGDNLRQYYLHYINYGKKEGRVANVE